MAANAVRDGHYCRSKWLVGFHNENRDTVLLSDFNRLCCVVVLGLYLSELDKSIHSLFWLKLNFYDSAVIHQYSHLLNY